MHIDSDILATIQEYRIHADPILGSDHASGAASLDEAIHRERETLVEDTPTGECVSVAAWGELAMLCSIASLTHAAFTNARFVRLFQFAFRETTSAMCGDATDVETVLPASFPAIPPTDQTHERAQALREALKADRDRWFIDAVDELDIDTDGVPAAFWLRGTTEPTATEQLVDWYAVDGGSEQLLDTLPALPGQATTTTTDDEDGDADTDGPQANLDMF